VKLKVSKMADNKIPPFLAPPPHQKKETKTTTIPPTIPKITPKITKDNIQTNPKQLPPTNPNIKQLPQTDPNIKQLPPTDPNIKQLPPTDPNIKQLPSTDPNIKQIPPTDPIIKQIPQTDHIIKQIPQTDPIIKQIPPTDPNIKKVAPTDPNIKKLAPTDPNIKKLPQTDPKIKQHPPTNPNVKQLQPTNDEPNVKQLQPTNNDPNVKQVPSNSPEINLLPNEPNLQHSGNSEAMRPSQHTNSDDAFMLTESIRNVYVLAPLKGHQNTLVTFGDDGEIRLLKTNCQIYTNDFYTLVKVKQDTTRATSAVKIVKAVSIIKGKSFHFQRTDLDQKIKAYRLRIEGVGKDATPATDEQIRNTKEKQVIEKVEGKVTWVASRIFSDKKNVKIVTATGMKLLISLNPPHHEAVEVDQIYKFVRVEKTNNWKSGSTLISDVAAKLQTADKTEISPIPNPSQALRNINKVRGEVICIEQQIVIFDQCTVCAKTRVDGCCIQSTCAVRGVKLQPNKKFVAKMVINDQENNVEAVTVWNDQLKDLPNGSVVPEGGDLSEVLVLDELEKHYLNKTIYFKRRNYGESICDVTLAYENDAMDLS
jgi:hypothetical protein